jgi:hypothetical protein
LRWRGLKVIGTDFSRLHIVKPNGIEYLAYITVIMDGHVEKEKETNCKFEYVN